MDMRIVIDYVNDVGFVISEEVLASGPGTGLITQSFCMAEVLLQ